MTKRWVVLMGIMVTGISASRAQEPVQWTYSAKAVADGQYEVRINAAIEDGWHLYAQRQPENAIAVPTTIHFSQNPLFELQGDIKEVGKLDHAIDPSLGLSANQYTHKVSFVQIVKLKSKVQFNVSGTIQFQVCTEQECLPPTIRHFDIPIKG
jgi:DsbC/DsbD-like thiol-disulfide interchange protein